MHESIEKRVYVVFLAMLGISLTVAVVAVRNARRSVASSDWVNHTHAVITEAVGVLSSLHAGDAALRDYLLSGHPRDQEAYRQAYAAMVEHITVAISMTRGEPAQASALAALEPVIAKHVAFAGDLVKTRQEKGLEAARNLISTNAADDSLSEIKRVVDRLKADQNALLVKQDKASFLQAQTTRWAVSSGVVANLALLAFAAWLIRDDLKTRRQAAAALREANEQLEAKVQARTAELAQTNKSLRAENIERTWSNQALEHQLRYSHLVINSINDAILVVSKALNVIRVNPAVPHLTGLETTELIGHSFDRVIQFGDGPPSAADSTGNPILQALKAGRELQDKPAFLINKAGQKTPVRLSLFPMLEQNKVVGGVVTVRIVEAPTAPEPRPQT